MHLYNLYFKRFKFINERKICSVNIIFDILFMDRSNKKYNIGNKKIVFYSFF